jgi:Fe2+ or Zn2+ uptake regulation protein
MAEQPASTADQVACHVKQCSRQASYSCERCGRAYCAEHIQCVSIERRQERARQDGGLTRLLTCTESYWLCPSCQNKPVPGKQLLQMP